ncbi:hypothetical protein CA983_06555 [Streptomyces swartbergensis]|uniref:Uncharacterized protein n=2 Tax=Streptomyces swartbergensis TaxID=487165 RepID=A0A243S8G3_9ACTN|nr:hypothetical protein CA983_06555 [Streptomyces swartbergensis]
MVEATCVPWPARSSVERETEDGSATCAFVMPSTVDGRAAHRADSLANDQDWHLVMWLRELAAQERHNTPSAVQVRGSA